MQSSQPLPTSRRPLAALVPLAVLATSIQAQAQSPQADGDGAVVVIAASRSNVEVDKAPQTVVVIRKEDIER